MAFREEGLAFEAKANGLRVGRLFAGETVILALLFWSFLILTCVSLVLVSQTTVIAFHINYDAQNALDAVLSVVGLGLLSTIVFAACPFSFGYFASFYFLSVAAAYLWLSYFTPLEYDHAAARISAIASFAAFLVPATMITEATIRRRMLTQRQMDILAKVLLGVVVAVVVCSAVFGFKFAWPTNGEARSAISHPMWLNYLISICAATLVPFIFAWFYQNSAWALMAASVAAGMALYPVSLNKTTFLAPYRLLALAGLIKFARARVAVLLTLLIPMLIGIVAFGLESPDKKPDLRTD